MNNTIEDIIHYAEERLAGQNAFIQIQVGNEYWNRRIGNMQTGEHAKVVTQVAAETKTTKRPFCKWMEQAIDNAAIAEGDTTEPPQLPAPPAHIQT